MPLWRRWAVCGVTVRRWWDQGRSDLLDLLIYSVLAISPLTIYSRNPLSVLCLSYFKRKGKNGPLLIHSEWNIELKLIISTGVCPDLHSVCPHWLNPITWCNNIGPVSTQSMSLRWIKILQIWTLPLISSKFYNVNVWHKSGARWPRRSLPSNLPLLLLDYSVGQRPESGFLLFILQCHNVVDLWHIPDKN